MLVDELLKILFGDESISYNQPNLEVRQDKDKFEIKYGLMYDPPKLNLDKLMELSKLFGTTKIDVDDYSYKGCETCDYGSDYGHTIQVYNATNNVEELQKLIDEDFDEKRIKSILKI